MISTERKNEKNYIEIPIGDFITDIIGLFLVRWFVLVILLFIVIHYSFLVPRYHNIFQCFYRKFDNSIEN